MNNSSRLPLWKSAATGYIELLFYFPFLLTFTILLLPSATLVWWLATLPLVYCIPLVVLRLDTKIRFITRWLLSLSAAAVHGIAVVMLTGSGLSPVMIVTITLFGTIFANRGYQQLNLGWAGSFHTVHMIAGIIAYVATQLLKMMMFKPLEAYTVVLNTGMIVAMFLSFVIVNERHVTSQIVDHRKSQALQATRKQNRLWMAALMALLVIVMVFVQFRQWMEEGIRSLLRAFFARFGTGEPALPIEEEPPPPFQLPPVEPKEFLFWDILQTIVFIVFTIFIIVATVVLLNLLIKKFGRGIMAMINKLLKRRDVVPETDAGYTDEVENLMTLTDMRNKMKERLRKLFGSKAHKGDEWNSLATNRERIRYLYRQWVLEETKQGYVPHAHLTPRETATEISGTMERNRSDKEWIHPFVEQYEDSRYGEKEPGDEEVNDYRSLLMNKRNKK